MKDLKWRISAAIFLGVAIIGAFALAVFKIISQKSFPQVAFQSWLLSGLAVANVLFGIGNLRQKKTSQLSSHLPRFFSVLNSPFFSFALAAGCLLMLAVSLISKGG